MEAVLRELVTDCRNAVMLHAAAVAKETTAILIPGISGSGKSTLAAWYIQNGYDYLTDELVALQSGQDPSILPFRRAITIREAKADASSKTRRFSSAVPNRSYAVTSATIERLWRKRKMSTSRR